VLEAGATRKAAGSNRGGKGVWFQRAFPLWPRAADLSAGTNLSERTLKCPNMLLLLIFCEFLRLCDFVFSNYFQVSEWWNKTKSGLLHVLIQQELKSRQALDFFAVVRSGIDGRFHRW
jgi:hypothetical protein